MVAGVRFVVATTITTRVETVSGAIYQFSRSRFADGTERTLLLRLPGRDGNSLRMHDQVLVERHSEPKIGQRMDVSFVDDWDRDTIRTITTSDVVRVDTWAN